MGNDKHQFLFLQINECPRHPAGRNGHAIHRLQASLSFEHIVQEFDEISLAEYCNIINIFS
jgi:hypothetical protein